MKIGKVVGGCGRCLLKTEVLNENTRGAMKIARDVDQRETRLLLYLSKAARLPRGNATIP
jgi:hypothetical protein